MPTTRTTPKPQPGQIVYEWTTDCDVPIICHLDYEPEQQQTEIDPAIPASVSLAAAYIDGVDILYLLDPRLVAQCEEAALISHLGG